MRNALPIALALPLTLASLAACGPAVDPDLLGDEDHAHAEDVLLGQNANGTVQGLARAGRWQLPSGVAAVGDQQTVEFNNAPPFDGGSNCSGGPTPGSLTFRDALLDYFPQIASIGIYNCRVIAGTNSMSLHGVGRALDIMLPTVGGDADNDLGDPIAHWLIENAEAIGIQTIIWDSSIWRVSRTPRFGEYTGSNPHVDHLHVELNIDASNKLTQWFGAPFGPAPAEPPFSGCEPLPSSGGVVEEDGPCFELHGPGQYWRTEESAGSGGSLLWTNAFENDTPSNHAEWKLPVSASGPYVVEVYLDPAHAQFASTHYELKTGSATVPLVVDQSQGDGWFSLGTFELVGGADVRLHVFDNHTAAVGDQKRIAVDAARVTPASSAPPDPPDEPTPEEPTPEEPTPEEPGPEEPTPEEPTPEEPAPVDDEDPGVIDTQHTPLPPSSVRGGCSAAGPSGAPLALALVLLALARRRR